MNREAAISSLPSLYCHARNLKTILTAIGPEGVRKYL